MKITPKLIISAIALLPYKVLDRIYSVLDKLYVRRTRNIRLIPFEDNCRGGKYFHAEWAHVIGIFQSVFFLHMPNKSGNKVLDIGCGTRLMAIACEPFLGENGKYTGIDVMQKDIRFCRKHYPQNKFEFIHFDINNPAYAPQQAPEKYRGPSSRTVMIW